MPEVILAINAGSSSVKVSVFSYEPPSSEPKQLATISVSGLSNPPAKLSYTRGDHSIKDEELSGVENVQSAYEQLLQHLVDDQGLPEIKTPSDIQLACHRIVHGGDYEEPTRIDRDTWQHLEALTNLAPLHNAGALEIVRAVHARGTDVNNIAFFDSAFHATIPKASRTYAIDQKVSERNKLRKYGFHGLSYAYITRTMAQYLGKKTEDTNLIALHLGSGASACAIRGGVSIDTTMGLTPVSGLPGATRSGDVDPALIFHFTSDAGTLSPGATKELHVTRAEEILNKESGWAALTGTTDFGAISEAAQNEGPEGKNRLAFDIFVDRIAAYVGSFYVKLGGSVDALVFAGGIGEKGSQLRQAVVEKVACLGFAIDEKTNSNLPKGATIDIGANDSRHKVLVCETDEQTEMARQCALAADKLKSG